LAQLMKHVGKFGEKPCVVVFRELPGESDYCLIVQTDTLESRQHDDLMGVVQSLEAQEANDISEVLHRRQFTDGSNMLSSLHYSKKLQKVPVKNVSLTPTPSQKISLADVNAEINKIKGGYVPAKTDPASQRRVVAENYQPDQNMLRPIETDPNMAMAAKAEEFAPSETNDEHGDTGNIARNLLTQASLLEEDARGLLREAEAKKAEAFRLDPSLRGPGRPRKVK
jgi:hypothetical protein